MIAREVGKRERSQRRKTDVGRKYERRRNYLVRLATIADCYVEALQSGSRSHNVLIAQRLGMKVEEVRDAITKLGKTDY
jgi:hypothetical protein